MLEPDDKYRLSQDDILARGPQLLDQLLIEKEQHLPITFYRKAWEFLFELRIDLDVAMTEKNIERQKLYLTAITAVSNMVKSILTLEEMNKLLGRPE